MRPRPPRPNAGDGRRVAGSAGSENTTRIAVYKRNVYNSLETEHTTRKRWHSEMQTDRAGALAPSALAQTRLRRSSASSASSPAPQAASASPASSPSSTSTPSASSKHVCRLAVVLLWPPARCRLAEFRVALVARLASPTSAAARRAARVPATASGPTSAASGAASIAAGLCALVGSRIVEVNLEIVISICSGVVLALCERLSKESSGSAGGAGDCFEGLTRG